MAAHQLWHSNQDQLAKEKASSRQEASTNATLQQHKRVTSGTTYVLHAGERPFKCDQCDYATTRIDNLRRHKRIHTGDRHQIRKHILVSQDENTKELEIEPIKEEGEL